MPLLPRVFAASAGRSQPSDGKYYGELAAEYGWNYEAGVKGEILNGRLQFDIAALYFSLQTRLLETGWRRIFCECRRHQTEWNRGTLQISVD